MSNFQVFVALTSMSLAIAVINELAHRIEQKRRKGSVNVTVISMYASVMFGLMAVMEYVIGS
jgi:hypothetical protein